MGRRVSRTDVRLSDEQLPVFDGLLPPWPGQDLAGVFVRTAPGPPTGGEPALFVHGLGGASTNWTDLMGLLAGRLEARALDLPGFGQSAPPANGRYSLGTHVRAVVRLLEHQDRGPVHLFGNSLGGAVSTRVAAWRPDLVRTLTRDDRAVAADVRHQLEIYGGPGRWTVEVDGGAVSITDALDKLAGRRLARQTPLQRAQAVLALCYGDPTTIPPKRLQEAADEVARRMTLPYADAAFTGSLRGLIRSFVERGPRNIWRQAASVQAPTLLVWGTEDRLVDVSIAPRAFAVFPHARLLILPGVGHVAQLERPETVARAFLALREDLAAHRATVGATLPTAESRGGTPGPHQP